MRTKLISGLVLVAATFLIVALIVPTSTMAEPPEPESVEQILKQAPERSDYPDSDAVLILDYSAVEVGEDGKEVVTVTNRMKLFNKQARQDYGEVEIPYVKDSGEPELNYVRTITPEGEVLKPDKDDIRDVTPAQLQEYPMYSDVKTKVISMPGLTNGSIIEYCYTIKPSRPLLKEDFSHSWLFQSQEPVMKSHFQVSFPSDMEVEWTDFDEDLPPTVKEEDERKTLSWEREDLPKITEEPGMPSIGMISDRVLVSSIENWNSYARGFWELAEGRTKSDEAINEKVDELTADLESQEKIVQSLYNYVTTKIRYVAIELGRGKMQPTAAAEVFENKYGDCKDKASLLISMLEEAGIEARYVLILSGLNEKTAFEEPPPGKGLNHVIVAVERENGLQFLDPTCDTCPYDYLPDPDRGKRALTIVPGGQQVKKIVNTDPFDPQESVIEVKQKGTIDEEGDLSTEVTLAHRGHYNYLSKAQLESTPEAKRRQLYSGLLGQLESGAALEDFNLSHLEDIDRQLQITLSYKKSGYADSLGDSLIFQTPPTLRLPLDRTFEDSVSQTAEKKNYPIQLIPSTFVQRSEITIPEGSEINTPDEVEIDNKWTAYESSYKTNDGVVHVTRTFIKKRSLVPLEGYSELKKTIELMRKDRQSKFQIE